MKTRSGIKGVSLSLLAMAVAGIPAHTAAEEQKKAEAVLDKVLEEVVVTARKRTESLQDVPLAVSAMSSEQLAISGAVDIGDIQSQIPGLTAYAARGSSNTLTSYIRGVGQSDPLYGLEPGVGLYLDDVYIARPQGALLEIFDVDRIEVLRGPQGTLYGRNSIGGAIKYVSKEVSNEQEGRVQVTMGNYGRKDISGIYSTPLIKEELFARVGVLSAYRDGFGKNRYTGSKLSDKQVVSGNFALQWEPEDDWTLKLSGDMTKDTSGPRGGQRMLENPAEARIKAIQSGGVTPLGSLPTGLPFYSLAAVNAYASANNVTPLPVSNSRYDTDSGLKNPRNDTTTNGISLTVAHDLNDNWSLKSITAYRKGDTDTTIDFDMGPLPLADVYATYFDNQFTQEFQFNFDNGDDWQFVSGLYYIDGEAGGDGENHYLLNVVDTAVTYIFPSYSKGGGTVDTTSASLYGEANWQVDEYWGITFGGRYTWEKKTAKLLSQGFSDDTFQTVISTETDFKGDHSWNNFSPKVGVDYQWSDDVLLYSSVSQGFKSGGYNVRAQQTLLPKTVEPYDEETVTAYEIGFKSLLLDRITLNAAYFYSQYEDIQLSIFTRVGNRFLGDLQNAGKGVIQGVELEFASPLTDEWGISGNVAYLHAEYKEFRDADDNNIADQQKFTNTPRWAATLNTTYDYSLGDHGDLLAYLSYSFRDEVIPTTDLSETLTQGAYSVIDASLTWRPVNESWTVILEGKNLTDKHYRTTGYDLRNSGFDYVQGFYGAPRTVALKVSYDF
ncbi:MAG: TonB-dependent receptor [Endozoicomonas sp.]